MVVITVADIITNLHWLSRMAKESENFCPKKSLFQDMMDSTTDPELMLICKEALKIYNGYPSSDLTTEEKEKISKEMTKFISDCRWKIFQCRYNLQLNN